MEVEQEAKELGWVPLEQFRGNPERWVDAELFVSRGKEIMPILRKNNERLIGKVEALEGSVVELQATLHAALESQAALREHNDTVAKESYDRAVRDLKTQRKDALKEGDGERVVVIEEALDQLSEQDAARAAAKAVEKKPEPKPTLQASDSPIYRDWETENSAWLAEPEKKAYALSMAQYLRATSKLAGKEFLDAVTKEVRERFPSKEPTSKVEGGSGEPRGTGKSYNALPREAREACDRMAAKLVGQGRAFKDIGEWRKSYASNYDWN